MEMILRLESRCMRIEGLLPFLENSFVALLICNLRSLSVQCLPIRGTECIQYVFDLLFSFCGDYFLIPVLVSICPFRRFCVSVCVCVCVTKQVGPPPFLYFKPTSAAQRRRLSPCRDMIAFNVCHKSGGAVCGGGWGGAGGGGGGGGGGLWASAIFFFFFFTCRRR